jgi:hypothetical protein
MRIGMIELVAQKKPKAIAIIAGPFIACYNGQVNVRFHSSVLIPLLCYDKTNEQ